MKAITKILPSLLIICCNTVQSASLLTSPKLKSDPGAALALIEKIENRNDTSSFVSHYRTSLSTQELEEIEDRTSTRYGACDLATNKICAINWTGFSREYFTDIEALPLSGNGAAIKMGLIRYNIQLGDDLILPFALLASDVTNDTDEDKINQYKLLDPEQGFNASVSYAWKYRINKFCQFANSSSHNGSCRFGINAGIRYLRLENMDSNDDDDIFGGYLEFAHNWRFPIYKAKSNEGEAGFINWYASAVYYTHNDKSSSNFFDEILDSNGNPIEFDETYGAVTTKLELYITDSVTLTYSYYNPFDSDNLEEQSNFTLKYNLPK